MPNLPTSPETRQKLEAAGYEVASRSPGFEEWSKGGFRFTLRDGLAPGIRPWAGTDYALPLGLALEFASIVGISPTVPAIHPNAFAFMEKAVTEALAELDKFGQPHRVGCNLAGAWGLMKGYLEARAAKEDAISTTEDVKS